MNTIITKSESNTEGTGTRSDFYLIINKIVEESPWLTNYSSATRVFTEQWTQIQQSQDRQKLYNRGASQLSSRGDTADNPGQQPPETTTGNSGNQPFQSTALNKPKGAAERSDTEMSDASTDHESSTSPEQRSKRMRAAEARHRLELLEEERELQDNLAEFWDPRFDKPQRNRFQYHPASAQVEAVPARRTQEHAVASHEPKRRSKQFDM